MRYTRSRRFLKWKGMVVSHLAQVLLQANDENMKKDIELVLKRLKYARSRDLPVLIPLLAELVRKYKLDLSSYIPTPEDVEEIFREVYGA